MGSMEQGPTAKQMQGELKFLHERDSKGMMVWTHRPGMNPSLTTNWLCEPEFIPNLSSLSLDFLNHKSSEKTHITSLS